MFKNLYILALVLICNIANAQDVFSPNDPIITYNSSDPSGSATNPTQPPYYVMSKWVRTSRMAWNTSKFKCYIWNGMNFRMRFPNNYNPANATKYPVLIFFHGGGEVGGIYDNEDQLLWAAQLFEQRINNGEWNGFLIFPQTPSTGWNDFQFGRVNSVLDTLQKYNNSDPDRLITMGLSMGGFGAVYYASLYPGRTAAALPASPPQAETLISNITDWVHVPVWFANGGTDSNPAPNNADIFYTGFRNGGGNIYQSYFVKHKSDRHYLVVGKVVTVAGILLSIVTAYIAKSFNNINDFLQLVFSFVNGPLFATFLLGMFWKRTTSNGAFFGLLAGTIAAAITHGLTLAEGKGGWIYPLYEIQSGMGQAFIVASFSWIVNFVTTIVVSLFTKPKPDSELVGLVYSLTEKPSYHQDKWYLRVVPLGLILLAVTIILNIIFF